MFIKIKVHQENSEVIFSEVSQAIDLKAEMTSRTKISTAKK